MKVFNAVEIAMASFGKKHGLKVIINPNVRTAQTNGEVVILPVVSKENESAMWGFVHHEAAHVRMTDFKAGTPLNGVQFSILNCIEDIWIEYNTILGGYAGAKKRFNDLNQMLLEAEEGWSPVTKNDQPLSAVCMYICFYGAYKITGYQSCEDAYKASKEAMLDLIGQTKLGRLESLICDVRKNKSTSDNAETAKAIYALFQEKQDSQSQGDSQDQSQSGSQGDSQDQAQSQSQSGSQGDSQDQAQSQSQSGSQGDSQDQAQSQSQSGSQGDSQDQDQGQSQSGSQGDSQDQDQSQNQSGSQGSFDLDEGTPENFDKGRKAADLLESGEVDSHHDMLHYENRGAIRIANKPEMWKRDLFRQAMMENAGLVSLLGSLFEAKNRTQREFQRQGKRLSVRRYAEMSRTCNDRVFANKTETIAPNTAVSLVVDNSASMDERVGSESRMDIANKSALVMVKSLEAIKGTSTQVHYFSDYATLAKDYNESCNDLVNRLSLTKGGTIMGNGIYNAGKALLQRAEPRKVMIVISDGDAGDIDGTKMLASELADNGVEMFFIAIDDQYGYESCKIIAPDKNKVQFLSSNKLVNVLMALTKDIAI